MNDIGIGKIITGEQQRDAIHIAVGPAVAAGELEPGQHVGRVGDGFGVCEETIGIVDPYLPRGSTVMHRQRFWLFLYPGSISSLRHEWEHPAWQETTETPRRKQGQEQIPSWRTPDVIKLAQQAHGAEDCDLINILADALEEAGCDDKDIIAGCRTEWPFTRKAQRAICLALGGETEEAIRWIESWAEELDQTYTKLMDAAERWQKDGEYTQDDSEAYKDVDYDKWPEFWKMYKVITGEEAREGNGTGFFTCSC